MLLLCALIWGIGITIQSISGESLGVFTVLTFKAAGGFVLVPFIFILKEKITKETLIGGFLNGLTAAIGNIFQQIGIVNSTIGKSSFITSLYMIFVPIIGLLFGKKIKKHVWLAVFIAIVGTYLLCLSETLKIQFGDISLLICAFVFGLQIIIIEKYANKVEPISFTCVQAFVMIIITSTIMFIVEKPSLIDIKDNWFLLFYVGIFSFGLGCIIQNLFQRYVEATVAGIIMSFESVFGVLGGLLILNQTLTMKEFIGCALILGAIIIAQRE